MKKAFGMRFQLEYEDEHDGFAFGGEIKLISHDTEIQGTSQTILMDITQVLDGVRELLLNPQYQTYTFETLYAEFSFSFRWRAQKPDNIMLLYRGRELDRHNTKDVVIALQSEMKRFIQDYEATFLDGIQRNGDELAKALRREFYEAVRNFDDLAATRLKQ